MALLHYLHGAGYREIVVVHVNHGMRGEASDGDERFVLDEAKRLGYQAATRRADVAGYAAKEKLSLESAARSLRYEAFGSMAREHDCPRVILAHHADDRIETALMNLFRGTGARGLASIRARTTRRIDDIELLLLRPLLSISREAINQYVTNEGITYREDASNVSDFALRNRVRNRLLPFINEIFGREVGPAVLKAADLAALDEAWAAEEMGGLPWKDGTGLSVSVLREMPEAKRNRILLSWLRERGVPNCGRNEVERTAAVALSSEKPAKASLPGGHHVRRRQGTLFIEGPA